MTDMSDTRVGTITASEDRFMQWKTADGDYSKIANKIAIRWTTLLDGMFPKERLLDILRNFICFSKSEEGTAKILAAYHQYFGVHKAVDSTLHAMNSDGRQACSGIRKVRANRCRWCSTRICWPNRSAVRPLW